MQSDSTVPENHSGRPQVPAIWLTVRNAAQRVQCSDKVIYGAVRSGKLRHAVANARGDLRFKPEWVDAWLEATAEPVEIRR